MTKIVEERHPGESWLQWKLGNLLSIDSDQISSVAWAWLFKVNGEWNFIPRKCNDTALFYNAVFFFRYTAWLPALVVQSLSASLLSIMTGSWFSLLPFLFGLFWSVRWAEVGPVIAGKERAYIQAGVGIKLNGRFAPLFRIQGDKSSAAGVNGPNLGQAQGFEFGTH